MEDKVKLFQVQKNVQGVRKIQALLMVNENLQRQEISSILGVTTETIRVWVRNFLLDGFKSFKRSYSPGAPSKLSKKQKRRLCFLIDQGPEYSSYLGSCWRTPMIQDLIATEFKKDFTCNYIAELLKELGYSYQKASSISHTRDKEERRIWLEETWPSILKEAKEKDSHVLFGDECSFSEAGTLSYTWARKGKTPIVKSKGSRKSYKVLGFVDYFTGNLYSTGYEGMLNSDIYIEFLKDVLKYTRKHIIIIQDGAKYHISEEVTQFIYENRKRISVYQLPKCSPDYNPIEKLWKKIKEKGTHLKYFPTFDVLVGKVHEMLEFFTLNKDEILSLFLKYDEITV